jgi:hypothetical protein
MEETNFIPPIENPAPPAITVEKQKNGSGFLISLLSILLLMSVLIAGFFAYQTQNLVKELTEIKYKASPVASATPDPAANWKTYTDSKGRFSFKYPGDWFIWNSPDGASLLLDESSFDPNLIAEPDQVEITFVTTASKEDINTYTVNFTPTSKTTTGNNVVFSINDRSLGPKEEGPASQYLFAQAVVENNLYRFGLTSSEYKTVFDQILESFKITEEKIDSSPVACTLEAKICPDGSAVGRSGPKCEFAACPSPKP